MKACYRLLALATVFFILPPIAASAQTSTKKDFSLQDLSGAVFQSPAATVYIAREFITMDPKKPRAQAVAVGDGKFIAVGTRAEVEALAGKGAKVDDTFADKVVIAGFVEQHVHPVLAALTRTAKSSPSRTGTPSTVSRPR